ncbi:conserved protein of unknown function [Methanocaldococcus lauensis]|uniref:Uncharacterized protein n=1 Tax=Methanocaldococcus lauensis TaxID=2546128 RepID=A0A8D6PQT6_9EURY|nr:hypothetical protein [Methanocaldococcus lauensis]CAB3288233.1 conserved protein of unknown function [Methanocaldococcus lauensis]
MKKELKDIKINKKTRDMLKILCTTKGYSSYDELINDMLKVYCKVKNIKISIMVGKE